MSKKQEKYPIRYTADDNLPEIAGNADFDITGYTITLRIEKPDLTALVKTATILDGPNGLFKFTFDSGDLVAGASQRSQVRFIDPSNKQSTFPEFFMDINKGIG